MKALFAILLSAAAFLAIAQGTPGYVVDGSGKIVKTGSGLCLHSGSYTAADAVAGCDPVVEKTAVKPVTVSGDVLFEFDSYAITPAGNAMLSKLAGSIPAGATVSVVGHTDRIGSAKYNQRLSQGRAAAVAEYLRDVTKAKYTASGVGATQPTQDTQLCTGMKNLERFKKCLAPDRRVVITVIR